MRLALIETPQQLAVILLLVTVLIAQSCDKETPEPEVQPSDSIVYSGDVLITDTVETDLEISVIIEPGTSITFGPEGILIVNGKLIAVGTEDAPIEFIGDPGVSNHLILKMSWDATMLELKHASITDGLVRSLSRENQLQYVTFTNTKQLEWNSALIRLWFNRMTIEDCKFYGNNRGEGILAHNMIEPVVQRCLFDKVPDGVEYIDSHYGLISDNIFIDNGDDGIDQNSCTGTMITNNEFYGVHDRAMELGSENFGSSKELIIHNNLFVNCAVGVNVKESSDATITNATFYSNGVAIDVQTPVDSSIMSSTTISQSIFIDEPIPVQTDSRSLASISDCLTDQVMLQGNNNVSGAITFDMDSDRQITVTSDTFPQGFDATTMGYQQ